nr:contractile injection system tape measure protein [Leptolyngbyaceae cyanobacterium MO_188.B28]
QTGNHWKSGDRIAPENRKPSEAGNTTISPPLPNPISTPLRNSHPYSHQMGSFSPPPTAEKLNHLQSGARQKTNPSSTTSQLELFSYFIQTGRLPWWRDRLTKAELENCCDRLLLDEPTKLKPLLQAQIRQETNLRRIIYQFSDPILLKFAKLLSPPSYQPLQQYTHDIQTLQPQINCLSQISPKQFRLTLWRGIFLILVQRSASRSSGETSIQESLLHIAACFDVKYRSLKQQLLSALDALSAKGVNLDSNFSSILAVHSQARPFEIAKDSTVSEPFQEAVDTLVHLLRALNTLNQEHPIEPSLSAKLDPLLRQLNSLRDGPNSPSKTLSPTQLIKLLTEIETLVAELDKGSPIIHQPTIQHIKTAVNSLKPDIPSPKPPSPPRTVNNPVEPFSASEEIYIQNAGLILLWPFLTRFFAGLNFLQANQFIDIQANQRAVLLLQYLVDASTEIPEHLLPLNKLLCGFDLTEATPSNLDITEPERLECENLLRAVIHNWAALKNTSPSGFRQAFLQRAGILRPYNGNWLLQVERETYDVLLDQLPWTIRVIKLPWLLEILHVEW